MTETVLKFILILLIRSYKIMKGNFMNERNMSQKVLGDAIGITAKVMQNNDRTGIRLLFGDRGDRGGVAVVSVHSIWEDHAAPGRSRRG